MTSSTTRQNVTAHIGRGHYKQWTLNTGEHGDRGTNSPGTAEEVTTCCLVPLTSWSVMLAIYDKHGSIDCTTAFSVTSCHCFYT